MRIGLLAVLFSLSAGVVQANSIIWQPVSAIASSTFSATYDIGNAIDQSGLSINYISGVTDFDAYIGLGPTHSYIANDLEWWSAQFATSAVLTFDMGVARLFNGMALWSEESSSFSTASVHVSVDGISYSALTSVNPTNNPLVTDYLADVTLFSDTYFRFIRLDITGCPQPNSTFEACALGEFALRSEVPLPMPGLMLLGALGSVLALRRRTT